MCVSPLQHRSEEHSLDDPPPTDFTCADKQDEGLYADVETECKFFHLCQKKKNGLHLVSTFMCPSGTIFNQPEGNCDTSGEVDCELYSQPEHLFSKSRSRNKRQVIQMKIDQLTKYLVYRHKRETEEESTEIYYEYEDNPSDENESEINSREEVTSSLEHLDNSEGTESELEDSNTSQEVDSVSGEQLKNEHSLITEEKKYTISDDVEKESFSESKENSKAKSDEVDAHPQSKSHNDKATNNNNNSDGYKLTDDDEKDNSSIEYEDYYESEEETLPKPSGSHENDSVKDPNSKSSSSESKDASSFEMLHLTKSKPEIIIAEKDNGTPKIPVQQSSTISNEQPKLKEHISEEKSLDLEVNQNTKEHIGKDSKIRKDPSSSNFPNNSEAYTSSNVSKGSTEMLELKVNQLLMKLNASVDDISSININATNYDYYEDYYIDEESIADLEKLREKILTVENLPQGLQKETGSLEIEQFRETVLSQESPISDTDNKQNISKAEHPLKPLENTKQTPAQSSQKTNENRTESLHDKAHFSNNEKTHIFEIIEVPQKFITNTQDSPSVTMTTSTYINGKIPANKDDTLYPEGNTEFTTDTLLKKSSTIQSVDKNEKRLENTAFQITENYADSLEHDISMTNAPVSVASIFYEDTTLDKGDDTIPTTDTLLSLFKHNTEENLLSATDYDLSGETTTDILTTIPSEKQKTEALPTLSTLLHLQKSRPVYRKWRTTAPPPPVVIRPNNNLRLPPKTTPTTTPIPVSIRPNTSFRIPPQTTPTTTPPPISIRPNGCLRIPPLTTPTTTPPPVSIRPNGSLRIPPLTTPTTPPPQVHIRPNPRLPKPSKRLESNKESSTESNEDYDGIKSNTLQSTVLEEEQDKEGFKILSEKSTEGKVLNSQDQSFIVASENNKKNLSTTMHFQNNKYSMDNAEHKLTTTSKSQDSERSDHQPFPENHKTIDYKSMTPSSVLPTFSRKNFAINMENKEITKMINMSPEPTTEPTIEPATELHSMEISPQSKKLTDDIHTFTSVEAHPPSLNNNLQEIPYNDKFTCVGKVLNEYLPDPTDCHHFHYCSQGFHSRQLLDFRFLCEKGTAFSPTTQHCESENVSLCTVLHN